MESFVSPLVHASQLLANSPAFFGTFMKLLSTCWSPELAIRASDWQLIVLRTSAILNAPYEWDVNEPAARVLECFSEAQFVALKDATTPLSEALFNKRQLLLARYVEEFNGAQSRVSEGTMREAIALFSGQGTSEISYVAGVYGFLARFMNSAKIDFDPPIEGLAEFLKKVNAGSIERERKYREEEAVGNSSA
jgi:hypothetical protein